MLTLAFDTSSKTAAVAVLRDNVILYDALINVDLNHSEVILPAIEQACRQTGIKVAEFDLFACTLGPGSFTGLRIGASTLKGLLLATQKPAAGVSSLAALAMNAAIPSKIICPVMDAGRGQVYTAYFHCGEKGLLEQIGGDHVLNPSDIECDHGKEVIFVGDGAVRYADIIKSSVKGHFVIASKTQQHIRASSVGILGMQKYSRNELLDAKTFVPIYLRSADAVIKKII